jgi:hypothetical protein
MSLYFVEHRHSAEACPTKVREQMLMLGQHVSQENADTFGIKIHSDIVHPGEHRMMMVLEAGSKDDVDRFVQPFSMVGSVDVKEVTNCEQVVQTSTC